MLLTEPTYNRTRRVALAWRARSLSQKALHNVSRSCPASWHPSVVRMIRSSPRRPASPDGVGPMRCELRGRGGWSVAVARDAAGGAAHELRLVESVRAERLPTVAVPCCRLRLNSPLRLNVRVEHVEVPSYLARPVGTGGTGALPFVSATVCGTSAGRSDFRDASTAVSPPRESGRTRARHRVRLAVRQPSRNQTLGGPHATFCRRAVA
jgi:hypothetical protein